MSEPHVFTPGSARTRRHAIRQTSSSPGRWSRPGVLSLLAAAVVLLTGNLALADAVRIDGLWIANVRVETIADGQLRYITSTGSQVTRSLERVSAINLESYPGLHRAWELSREGEHAQALAELTAIRTQTAWVRHWVQAQIVETASQAGQVQAAVEAYVELARAGAERQYLERSPTRVLSEADEQVRARLANAIRTARDGLPADHAGRAPLDNLLSVAQSDEQTLREMAERRAAASAVAMPSIIREDDPVARLLREARYREALELADQRLRTPGGADLKYYQRGMAQLQIALEMENEDPVQAAHLTRSAGLSFMRTVIHFPRSPYAGPALLEAGYVHARIGRPDIAANLYNEAAPLIDEESDPDLAARLVELRRQLQE